jgi:hypothetical protein
VLLQKFATDALQELSLSLEPLSLEPLSHEPYLTFGSLKPSTALAEAGMPALLLLRPNCAAHHQSKLNNFLKWMNQLQPKN